MSNLALMVIYIVIFGLNIVDLAVNYSTFTVIYYAVTIFIVYIHSQYIAIKEGVLRHCYLL